MYLGVGVWVKLLVAVGFWDSVFALSMCFGCLPLWVVFDDLG